MRELKLVGIALLVFGAALAAAMQGLIIYASNTDPTSVPIVPGLVVSVGGFIALTGLLVLLVWFLRKKKSARS